MAQDKEKFRNNLKKIAESIDILESLYPLKPIKLTIDVSLNDYLEIVNYLNTNNNDDKCIISIGNSEITFLKK